jgi:hypothetical protein
VVLSRAKGVLLARIPETMKINVNRYTCTNVGTSKVIRKK